MVSPRGTECAPVGRASGRLPDGSISRVLIVGAGGFGREVMVRKYGIPVISAQLQIFFNSILDEWAARPQIDVVAC